LSWCAASERRATEYYNYDKHWRAEREDAPRALSSLIKLSGFAKAPQFAFEKLPF